MVTGWNGRHGSVATKLARAQQEIKRDNEHVENQITTVELKSVAGAQQKLKLGQVSKYRKYIDWFE